MLLLPHWAAQSVYDTSADKYLVHKALHRSVGDYTNVHPCIQPKLQEMATPIPRVESGDTVSGLADIVLYEEQMSLKVHPA